MQFIRGNFRPGSRRGLGLRIGLKRHQVGQWVFAVGRRVKAGSSEWKVAGLLAALIGPDGRLDPTKAWLAAKLELAEKTVERALSRLSRLGFLTWHRRTAVTAGVEHQTSNAYQLAFPEAASPAEEAQEPSTAPLVSLSVDREESIPLEQVLSDTPRVRPRNVPAREFRRARAALEKAVQGAETRLLAAWQKRYHQHGCTGNDYNRKGVF